jgi:hypothetical protein
MHAGSNRSIGEMVADALMAAAEAKNDAATKRRKADRILDACLLQQSGGSADERKAKARQDIRYIQADDAALEAEHRANIEKARADGMELRFDEWRSLNATERASMTLR